METNLVVEGLKFMALGMGTVFLFLTMMILCMYMMSNLINRFFSELKIKEDIASTSCNSDKVYKNNNPKMIAAITAAIIHHRKG